MTWHCTLTPTRFRFQLQEYFWQPRTQMELHKCCCLQDGLKTLALEGVNLKAVVAASFETEQGQYEFSSTELNEIRAIALEEAGCS